MKLGEVLLTLVLVPLIWLLGLPNYISAGLSVLVVLLAARYREIKITDSIENDLRRDRAVAEEANRAKGVFLANMSHEIRTPLNGILGVVDLVLEGPLSTEQKDYVNMVRQSANNLLDIVNDILDFSKIEAGGMEFSRVPFTLGDALDASFKMLAYRAQTKGLKFRFIDESALDKRLLGDPGRLRQIVVNLVGNAIKFTERGSVEVRVSTVSRAPGTATLRFSIHDTGIGISRQAMGHLFNSFAQADPSISRVFGGSGLGLAISKGLATAMGGRIWVDSEPGTGSDFYFELPFELDKRLVPRENPNALPAPAPGLPSLHILLVEDNGVNRLIANRLLSKRGHRVSEAATAQAALDCLEREPLDLVLMDLQLPGMGGLEALSHLRASKGANSQIPVIALTAHALIGDRERCLSAGMNGYVSKPFTADTLLAEIASVMDASDFAAQTSAPAAPADRFKPAIEGLDGDLDLFSDVVALAIPQFQNAAVKLLDDAAASDYAGMGSMAHQLKSYWALYAADGQHQLPDLLMTAVKAEDAGACKALVQQFSTELDSVARELGDWQQNFRSSKSS